MTDPEKKPGKLEDAFEVVLRRKWALMIPFFLALAGSTAAFYLIPPVYQSQTLILVEPQKIPEEYVRPTTAVDIEDELSTISQQVMSRTRLETIIQEFDLYPGGEGQTLEDRVNRMRGEIGIEIEVEGSRKNTTSNAFTISFQHTDPETAMHVTNKLASLFIEENLKVREQQAEGTTQFLDTQLQEVKKALAGQEARVRAFKQNHIGELPSQLETNLRTLDRLQLELQATRESLRIAEDRKATLEREILESNPLKGQLVALRGELAGLEGKYTGKYPEITRLRNEIRTLEMKLADEQGLAYAKDPSSAANDPISASLVSQYQELSIEVNNLKEKSSELTWQIQGLQGQVERTPGLEQQLASLIRDYDNTKDNYQSLLEKKLDAQLSENLEKRQKGEQFTILDPANFPEKPIWPKPVHIFLIGIFAGLGTGGGLILLLERLDSSFRKMEDLYQATGLPVLATIPYIQYARIKHERRYPKRF